MINDKSNQIILTGSRTKGNIYIIKECGENESRCLITKDQENYLWHQRIGHINFKLMKILLKNEIGKGIPKLSDEKSELCKACQLGKQIKKSFKGLKDISSSHPLELIYMDLIRPTPVQSIGGKKFILVMVDDCSHFGWIAFLHAKSDAVDNIIRICNKIQVKKDCKIRKIRSDRRGEFENENFAKFCDNIGTIYQFSAPKTP